MAAPVIFIPPSSYLTKYNAVAFMRAVNVTTGIDVLARPTQQSWLLDALDQRFVDLLASINSYTPFTYTGQKLTTICYQVYGIQNLGLIVLAFNGLSAPWELRSGMVLKMPNIQDINNFIAQMRSNQTPKSSLITF